MTTGRPLSGGPGPAAMRDAASPSGAYRPENVELTDEELLELGWLFSGTGWLCPDWAPGL